MRTSVPPLASAVRPSGDREANIPPEVENTRSRRPVSASRMRIPPPSPGVTTSRSSREQETLDAPPPCPVWATRRGARAEAVPVRARISRVGRRGRSVLMIHG
jgi:hypothetical protein